MRRSFANATSLSGLNSASWNPTNQLAVTNRVNKNTTYTEAVSEPQPTTADLTVAGEALSPEKETVSPKLGPCHLRSTGS